MYNSCSINNNDNVERRLSQEYSSQTYHEMQPVPVVSQSPVDIHRQNSSSLYIPDSRFDSQRPGNQSMTSVLNPTTIDNRVAPVTSEKLPAKKRRVDDGTLITPSTAPLPRKRFDPNLQNTASALMSNIAGSGNTIGTKAAASATKSVSETTQNRLNQLIKPLIKLCEETNQLMKELLKQTTDQTRSINELASFPDELKKATQQLSNVVHMQAKVLETRQHNDDENLAMMLNGIDLSRVTRGASLNSTARNLVRSAYGESASFADLAAGEFDMLLGFLARIHGIQTAGVFANSQAIKNSLQQMKHDKNKRASSTKSSITLCQQRTSTANELAQTQDEDDDDDDVTEF